MWKKEAIIKLLETATKEQVSIVYLFMSAFIGRKEM